MFILISYFFLFLHFLLIFWYLPCFGRVSAIRGAPWLFAHWRLRLLILHINVCFRINDYNVLNLILTFLLLFLLFRFSPQLSLPHFSHIVILSPCLISLLIVNFDCSLFMHISSIDSFCVVVRDSYQPCCFGDWVVLEMD